MEDRLQKLIELDERIGVELLGNGRHPRYDLIDLRKVVRAEIRKITSRVA